MNGILVVPKPLGIFARIANAVMVPLMYFLAGTLREEPQHTHPWTVQRLTQDEVAWLDFGKITRCKAVKNAIPHHHQWDPRFHMPIFTGWRRYALLNSFFGGPWYVGWQTADGKTEVSRIRQVECVRVLLGPEDVLFFGVDKFGFQIPISQVGEGQIGDGGPFCQNPLS